MPKNPSIPPSLRTLCETYLDETPPQKWAFTDFWPGNKNLLSSHGHVWTKTLLEIANTTSSTERRAAAIAARHNYKQREHIPAASRKPRGIKKLRKKGKSYVDMEPPPSYDQSSQDPLAVDPAAPRNLYEQQYLAIPEDRKWRLPSGRAVEDVLFDSVVSQWEEAKKLKQSPKESYAHSYILDTDDTATKALFNIPGEWEAIMELVSPLPTVCSSLEIYMRRFVDVQTPAALRHRLLTTPYFEPDETYDADQHGDNAWIYSALTSLVLPYERDLMADSIRLEAWFQINIWGPIFDRCFQSIPGMDIKRTESQSPFNADRKNVTPLTRKPIGSKYDGIITCDRIEYGAVEDARLYEGEKSRKWQSDSLKLVKLLHDQLRGLEGLVRHDRDVLARFRCVGFLTAGLHCQGLYLQYGRGLVCLLRRSARCTVPDVVAPLASLIAVLVSVWRMRQVVRDSVGNLKAFLANTEVLFKAAVDQVAIIPAILPTCFDTDTEL